jgi:predicted Zn-dependent protease
MAQQQGAANVTTLLESDPGRVETLHTLTGGNPRTIVLLFSVLAQGTDGDVRTDLEKLLDQCTPLYQARFEALPAQAQQVVDAIAIHWDPISAGELAQKLSMDVNTISAQVNRLVQQGVLAKVEYDPATRIGFQVAERFFNIWYLMRASRRVRRRLIWLVQFLRTFYGAAELRVKVERVLRSADSTTTPEKLRHAEMCLALAEVVEEDRKMRSALESTAIRALLSDDALNRQIVAILDLDGLDASLRSVVDRERWTQQFNSAVDALPIGDQGRQQLRDLVGGCPQLSRAERLAVAQRWTSSGRKQREELLLYIKGSNQLLAEIYGASLASRVVRAVRDGYMDTWEDETGAIEAAVALDCPELEAPFAASAPDGLERLRRLSLTSADPFIGMALAGKVADAGENEEALQLIETALQADAFALAHFVQADVLANLGRIEDAIGAATAGLARAPNHVPGWRRLAKSLFDVGRAAESIEAYRKALAIAREAPVLVELGRTLSLMDRDNEAVVVLREALSSGDGDVSTALYLAIGLVKLKEDAEASALLEQIRQRSDLTDDDALVCGTLLFALHQDDPAMQLLEPVLPRTLQAERSASPVILEVLRVAASRGHASTIADLMEKLELHELMQPIYVALRIAGGASRGRLKRLSPETREATEALLKEWDVPEVNKNATKKSRTRRKRV